MTQRHCCRSVQPLMRALLCMGQVPTLFFARRSRTPLIAGAGAVTPPLPLSTTATRACCCCCCACHRKRTNTLLQHAHKPEAAPIILCMETKMRTFSAMALSTTALCFPVLRAQLPFLCAATAAATAASTSSTVPAGMRPITPAIATTNSVA